MRMYVSGVQCPLTTQISACLQEQVGLMSISSWTLSFSSSPRTWLNFFMKSWAFPASGRFSANTRNRVWIKPTDRLVCVQEFKKVFVFITYWQYSSVFQTWLCYWPQTNNGKREMKIRYIPTWCIKRQWRCQFCGFECGVCVSAHHWQLVQVQQLLYKASEHVLTLPHLIQSPGNKDQLHRNKWEGMLCFVVLRCCQ